MRATFPRDPHVDAVMSVIFAVALRRGLSVVVAGGAVVDPTRASDIDVFVLGYGLSTETEELAKQFGPLVSSPGRHDGDGREYEEMAGNGFHSIGTVTPAWSPLPLQFIRFNEDTIKELLESFDLSVHMWALDRSFTLHRVAESSYPGDPITVNTPFARDNNTPVRLAKLRARYGDNGRKES